MVRSYWTGPGVQPTIPTIKAAVIKKLPIVLKRMSVRTLFYHRQSDDSRLSYVGNAVLMSEWLGLRREIKCAEVIRRHKCAGQCFNGRYDFVWS
jgi:hypothetical protein